MTNASKRDITVEGNYQEDEVGMPSDPSARDYECWDEELPTGFCARCGFTLDDHHYYCGVLPKGVIYPNLYDVPLCPAYCTGPQVVPIQEV